MKKALTLICLLTWQYIAAQNIVNRENVWNLTTENSVYQLLLEDDRPHPVYFGNRSAAEVTNKQKRSRPNGPHTLEEIPVRGGFADKMAVVEATFADGVRDIELKTVGIHVRDIGGKETLVIETSDRHYPFAVTQYISVIPECDMYEKWITIANTSGEGGASVTIENLLSGSFT